MLKSFFTLILLYSIALVSILAHLIFYQKDLHNEKITQVARIMTLPTLSLSTSYMAEDIRSYDVPTHPGYPDIMPIDTMSFIYEK